MKKISLILLLSFIAFVSFGQYTTTQTLGAPATNVKSRGGLSTDSSYTQGGFADTSSANLGFIKNIPFTQIRVGTNYYIRNSNATRWVLLTSTGNSVCAGRIAGGVVVWSGSGLTYTVSPADYCINGNSYHSPFTSVTLVAADPSLPRLDVICVDTNNAVVRITGTPNANPAIPQVNPASQLYLTSIFVPAGATSPPNVTSRVIWDENIGAPEYTGSASGVTVDFNNTTSPYHLTKATSTNAFTNGNTITYTGTTYSLDTFNVLQFFIKNKAIFADGATLSVQLLYNGNPRTTSYPIIFDKDNVSSYQVISLPLSYFTYVDIMANNPVNGIQFSVTGNNTAGVYIDFITLNGGTPTGNSPYITNVRRRSGTDTVEVQKNGIWEYAFIDSTGGSGSGVNIYNSDGTITDENRNINGNSNSINFLNNTDFYVEGGESILLKGDKFAQSSQVGVTSGYSVTIGTYTPLEPTHNSALEVYRDSVGLSPYKGNFAIDSLNSSASTKDKMLVWDSISGVVRTRPLPNTGNDSLDIPLQGTYAGKPVTGDINFEDGYSERGFNKANVDEDFNGNIHFGDSFLYLSANSFDFSENTSLSINKSNLNISSNVVGSVGLTGTQDFSANVTNLDYPQLIKVKQVVSDSVVKLTAGTNVTITGSGTSGSPYNISASSSGGASTFVYLSQMGVPDDASLAFGSTTFGTDGTSLVQGILNTATATNPLVVYWDTHTSITGIKVKSNTRIVFSPKCGMILRDSSNNFTLSGFNLNQSAIADSNITIEGAGIINGNGSIQRQSDITHGQMVALFFAGTKNLTLKDFTIYNPASYNFLSCYAEDILIQNVTIDNSQGLKVIQDGFDFLAYHKNVTIRDCKINTGDDHIVFAANGTGVSAMLPSHIFYTNLNGDQSGIVVDNVAFDGNFGIRLISSANKISKAVFNNIHGRTTGYWLVVDPLQGGDYNVAPGNGVIDDITFSNISVSVPTVAPYGTTQKLGKAVLNSNINRINFINLNRSDFELSSFPSVVVLNDTINRLNFINYNALDTAVASRTFHLDLQNASRINQLNFNGSIIKTHYDTTDIVAVRTSATIVKAIFNGVVADSAFAVLDNGGTVNDVLAANIKHTGKDALNSTFRTSNTISSLTLSNYFGTTAKSGTYTTLAGDAFTGATVSSYGKNAGRDSTILLLSNGTRYAARDSIGGGSTYTPPTYTAGSVLFAGTGGIPSQINSKFFYDSTNQRLGLGTNTPSSNLEILDNNAVQMGIRIKNFNSTGISKYDAENDAGNVGQIFKLPSAYGGFKILAANDYGFFNAAGGDFAFLNNNASGAIKLAAGGSATSHVTINPSGSVTMGTYGAGAATFDASGNITSVSDERLKTNIQPYNTGLKELMKLKPIQYKWNALSGNETKGTYAGFSAQNVKANIPLGTGENSAGYLSLQDRALIATLVNAVQEQQEQIKKQQVEINKLKKRLNKKKQHLTKF